MRWGRCLLTDILLGKEEEDVQLSSKFPKSHQKPTKVGGATVYGLAPLPVDSIY